MSIKGLGRLLVDQPALIDVVGRRSSALSAPEPAWPLAIAGLVHQSERRPVLVATPTGTQAERLGRDLSALLGPDRVEVYPAWETLPFERVSPTIETMGQRLRVLWRLGRPSERPDVIVASVRALLQRLGPDADDVEPIEVAVGDVCDPLDLVERLVGMGYHREYQVEHRGEVAVRGSILDVFPSTADAPVRIDLFGDDVDRLTEFSVNDQRSMAALSGVQIFPARELVPSPEVRARAAGLVGAEPWGREHWERLAEGLFFDGMESWLPWLVDGDRVLPDLLDADAQIVVVEPRRMRDRATDLLAEEADLARTLARTWGVGETEAESADADLARLHVAFDRMLAEVHAPVITVTAVPESPEVSVLGAYGWEPVVGGSEILAERLRDQYGDGWRVVICADGAGSAERIVRLLAAEGLSVQLVERVGSTVGPGLWVTVASIERGAVIAGPRLALLSESDITGRRRAHRVARVRTRDARRFVDDLEPGDHVVHHQHGVGRFAGMVTRAIGGVERDYLLIEYRGDDRLYVPSDQIDSIHRYSGGESPSLNRLGGSDWSKSKARVRAEVNLIAQELVVLYQKRMVTVGHAFQPDTPWQREMEDAFPYTETPDQLQAIIDVKRDMDEPVPMDRLVVGDVGFGKTEVALRAAFKAVQDRKQVAILVPTTLLAQQHFQTFSERFADYPVRVEVLSRFLTPGQARKVVEGVGAGEVDVVIGTHRLLSEDVRFKDLGLLVVDEEQRFGVGHKEAIKNLKSSVDVLTLSATPIPRTLEMSLTGIRDLSMINTPPADRQPILTYVGEHDDRAVAEAIRRELLREGQVFFVHNRVRDIELVAERVRRMVPEARIAVAHGQMDEGSLERIVLDFWEGEYDVLVCTTIIESGIDMPTVNTLVVDRADLLGLGQLHQLRGRVGRAGQRAYAYLFTPRDHTLTEEAYERLKTIGESTELGSGFAIAMRDLEIRGAGNLLGVGQSGHIAAVGYDLYCQMVSEAVAELRGEKPPVVAEVKIDVPTPAFLPEDYVTRSEQRLEAYRRLSATVTSAEVEDLAVEWVDRYGPMPPPAAALVDVGRLRAACLEAGITELSITKPTGFAPPVPTVQMQPVKLRASRAVRLKRLYPKTMYNEDSGLVRVPLDHKDDVVAVTLDLIKDLILAP